MIFFLWVLLCGSRILQASSYSGYSGGSEHSCWVHNGLAYCAGSNAFGQLVTGLSLTLSRLPLEIPLLGVDKVRCGSIFSCFQQGSDVYCAGYNGDGQMGQGTITPSSQTSLVLHSQDVQIMAPGAFVNCVILTNSTLVCSGTNAFGQMGLGHLNRQTRPIGIAQNVNSACSGAQHICYTTNSGSVHCAGNNNNGQIGTNSGAGNKLTFESPIGADALSVSCGGFHNCVIMATGGLRCWGSNFDGQLGTGDTTDHKTPVAPLGFVSETMIQRLSLGYTFTVVRFSNASTMGWGSNIRGQLGLGNTNDPIPTPSLSYEGYSSVDIGTSWFSSCIQQAGETYVCTGANSVGMLGYGSTDQDTGGAFIQPPIPPTESPSASPVERLPTISPSAAPVQRFPSVSPTASPSYSPSGSPSISFVPTSSPTVAFGVQAPDHILVESGTLEPVLVSLKGEFTSALVNVTLTNTTLDGGLGLRGVVSHYLSSCPSPNAVGCKSLGFVATKEEANDLLSMLHFEYTRLVNGTQSIHIYAKNDLDEEVEASITVFTKPSSDLSQQALLGVIATASACGVLIVVLGFASLLC